MTAQLVIESWHGRIFVAVDFTGATESERHRIPRPKRIALSDADARLPLDLLKRLYANEIASAFPSATDTASAALRLAEEKKLRLLNTLRGIIASSAHDGEVQAARAAWKKLTGKEFA